MFYKINQEKKKKEEEEFRQTICTHSTIKSLNDGSRMKLVMTWWSLSIVCLLPLATTMNILLPQRDVLHKSSGLVMKYVSEYKPANEVMAITISIPVVASMCYIIPWRAMKKIPICDVIINQDNNDIGQNTNGTLRKQEKNDTLLNRNKRFILDIISIAVGTAATTLAFSNILQINNLQKEIKSVQSSMQTVKDSINVHNSQLFQLTKSQIKIIEELHHTQSALNNTITVINEHSNAIKQQQKALATVLSMLLHLRRELSAIARAMETHFIQESMEDIFSNKLNLRFIHPYDLPSVLKIITKQGNINVDEGDDTLPILELVNQLLIQQRIDFVQSDTKTFTKDGLIGNLLFTSFFAATTRNQQQFSTYKLTAIPFNRGNQRWKLAQLPDTISISAKTYELIKWTRDESFTCKFKALSSCRETPPIQKNWQETCLFEILTDANLTLCRIEHELEHIFIQRIGQQWAISMKNETKCHRVTQLDQEQHAITADNEITIPPIALLTIDRSTTWSCDHFLLPGIANNTDELIRIIDNKKVNYDDSKLIDLYRTMSNETRWKKIPHIPADIQGMFEYLLTTAPVPTSAATTWYQHGTTIVVMIIGIIAATSIILYAKLRRITKKIPTAAMIAMPPI